MGKTDAFLFCSVIIVLAYTVRTLLKLSDNVTELRSSNGKLQQEVKTFRTDIGATYTRWGRKTCPELAELVYSGQVGGMHYTLKGGGSNKLCLPNDPENGYTFPYENNGLYGSEYEVSGTMKPSLLSSELHDKEVPCAVCRRRQVSSIIVIPGRKSCYQGWNMEYNGFLMAAHSLHHRSDYSCIDMAAEPLDGKGSNENGALFYQVKTKCGSLRCPPYIEGTEVYCVVCSK